MQKVPQQFTPGIWLLFRIWAGIGLQSFGGGASTAFLIQRTFIEKYGWLTQEEFSLFWNLCLFTPGINLLALTILIGRKLSGTWGIVSSLLGLLLPSATITCLFTAGFAAVQHIPTVQAVFRGIIPATAGLMLMVGLGFAQPLLKLGRSEGLPRLVASAVIILGSAAALIVFKLSVILVLFVASGTGVIFFTPWRNRKRELTA